MATTQKSTSDPKQETAFVSIAARIAHDAHKDQKRKFSGLPYINHPIAVVELLKQQNARDRVLAAGYLHDVLEDTTWTIQDLYDEGIPNSIVDIVIILTHNKNKESYLEYIQRVKLNPLAKAVKKADIIHNLSDLPTRIMLRDKYELALALLNQ